MMPITQMRIHFTQKATELAVSNRGRSTMLSGEIVVIQVNLHKFLFFLYFFLTFVQTSSGFSSRKSSDSRAPGEFIYRLKSSYE